MKTIIGYSGGKDTHLALMQAMRDGQDITGILHADGGKEHLAMFHETRKVEIIKAQVKAMGFRFYTLKLPAGTSMARDAGDPKNAYHRILDFIKAEAEDTEAFYFGNTGSVAESATLRSILAKYGLKSVDMYHNRFRFNYLLSLRQVLKQKIKAVIVCAPDEKGAQWLGRVLDADFIAYIRSERAKGNKIFHGDFQTLVVESPVTNSEIQILKSRVLRHEYAEEGYFLDILDWKLVRR